MKPNDKKTLAQVAVENVKAWLVNRPIEEITEIMTHKGEFAGEGAYVALARIASGKRAGEENLLPCAWYEIRQMMIDAIRDLRNKPNRAVELLESIRSEQATTAKRKSAAASRNARKKKWRETRDDPQDIKDAVTTARERIRAKHNIQTACEYAIEKHQLTIGWKGLNYHLNKNKRRK